MKTIITCDPGKTGAFLIINEEGRILECLDMPLMDNIAGRKTPRRRNLKTKKMSGGNVKRVVDTAKIHDWIMNQNFKYNISWSAIEELTMRRDQSVNATSSQAMAWQSVFSAMEINLIPIKIVHPIVWKSYFKFTKKGKDYPRKILVGKKSPLNEKEKKLFTRIKADRDRSDAFYIGLYSFYMDKIKKEK